MYGNIFGWTFPLEVPQEPELPKRDVIKELLQLKKDWKFSTEDNFLGVCNGCLKEKNCVTVKRFIAMEELLQYFDNIGSGVFGVVACENLRTLECR